MILNSQMQWNRQIFESVTALGTTLCHSMIQCVLGSNTCILCVCVCVCWCVLPECIYSTSPYIAGRNVCYYENQPVVKPLIQIHHHSLLSSINHLLFFSALTTKWICFGRETITRALSQIGLLSGSAPVKVCQVFDASLLTSPTSTSPISPCLMEMLAGYRC